MTWASYVVKDVIYLSAIGSFDKYLDWVFHMVTKQTQSKANDAGMVTRCFYERKQLAGNYSVVFRRKVLHPYMMGKLSLCSCWGGILDIVASSLFGLCIFFFLCGFSRKGHLPEVDSREFNQAPTQRVIEVIPSVWHSYYRPRWETWWRQV